MVSQKHPLPFDIESNADSLHHVGIQDLRWSAACRVQRGAVDRITPRGISTIGPVDSAAAEIQFQIDRLRQTVEQDFDVPAVSSALALRHVDARAQDAALSCIIRALL